MPLDTFICGNCQGAFCDIEAFMNHKKDGCMQEQEQQQQTEIIQVQVSGEVTSLDETTCTTIPLVSVGDGGSNTPLTFYNETESPNKTPVSGVTDQKSTLVILKDDLQVQTLTSESQMTTSDKGTSTTDIEPKVKKKGKPKARKKTEALEKKETGRPPLPERGADGRFTCTRCKRSFIKDRYFNTHKCLSDDYVDITKKEVFSMDADDDDEIHDAGEIDEDIDEYTAPVANDEPDDELPLKLKEKQPKSVTKTHGSKMSKLEKIQIISDPDVENTTVKKVTDAIEDIPVFKNDTEKLNFEASVNVDLSGMDGMFTKHSIEQDLLENMTGNGKNVSNELSLYMCNVCSKVFKTLSHIRLHCLIHTELKPFKCPHCEYASNSKGNLYTHMRRHTGQFYTCQKCPFHTVNKSHLIEHEATHSNTRYLCNLCKKDYNTQKSLINHIRKYHSDSQKGKDYLAMFLNKRSSQSQTVIHQCHVCNRKFKKKIDRDRHLFVHDIKDIPNIQKCELCDYTASRKVYLEKHYLKHRVIYCCYSCPQRFLSSVRLIDHINSTHVNNDISTTWETLFEQCIENSIYLPEPDDQIQPGFGSEILNLPPELSKTSLDLSDANKLAEMVTTSASETLPTIPAVESSPMNVDPPSTNNTSGVIDMPSTNQSEEMMETDQPLIINGITENLLSPPTSSDLPADQTSTDSDMKATDSGPTNKVSLDGNAEKTVSNGEDASLITKSEDDTSLISKNGEDVSPVSKNKNDQGKQTEENAVNGGDESTVDGELKTNEADITDSLNTTSEVETEAEANDDEAAAKLELIIAKLGYRGMSMKIFHKMRETFGSEECEYCGRLFYSKVDFEAHQRIHTGERPFQCELCQFKAMNNNILKKHLEKEHEVSQVAYQCGECEFTTNTRNTLWNHRLKHLAVVGLQCPKCVDKFESLKQLRSHLLEKHPYIEMEELEKLTGYKHRLHGKMGRRSYKCPYCDKIFMKANSELQKHIWMHEGIKPFKCSLCQYSCRSKNNLQAHMLRHSTEKPFHCEECGKLYKSRTALRWHVRSHKDGKMFKCMKCPYEAAQRSHLKRHMETHDVLKRFACQECDYTANTVQFMKIHYARNHKGVRFESGVATEPGRSEHNVESRVFKCVSCDYLFGNMSELKRHLRVRHQVQAQDMVNLESMEMSEVQVVQYVDEGQEQQIASTELQQVQEIQEVQEEAVEAGGQLDEKTVSAVSLLQQIIDMSHQGAFSNMDLTVMNEEGQMVAVNPDTIIVQQDGEEVLVADGDTSLDGSQYVIQYVSQDGQIGDVPQDIQTTEETNVQ